MRWTRRALAVAPALLLVGPAAAQSSAGLVVHMTAADFSQGGCPLIVDEDLACGAIDPVGDGSIEQFAWIIAYGWSSLAGWGGASVGLAAASFGVRYPPETHVTGWISCTDLTIPLDDLLLGTWPESDTGVAVAFTEGYNPLSGFATLGFLRVQAGSSGTISIAGHAAAQIGDVQFVSSLTLTFDVPREGWSVADVGGDAPASAARACDSAIPAIDTSWSRIKAIF